MQESLFDTDPAEPPARTPVVRGNDITYGKLKGQPLDLLLAQPDYAMWLLTARYSLLRKNHPVLFTWLVRSFGTPDSTPEHNALQNRFLEPRFCRQLVAHLYPRLEQQLATAMSAQGLERAWRASVQEGLELLYSDYSLPFKHDFAAPLPDSHRKQREVALQSIVSRLHRFKVVPAHSQAATADELPAFGLPAGGNVDEAVHRFWAPVISITNPMFEVEGADIQFDVHGGLRVETDYTDADYRQLQQHFGFAFEKRLRIEVKPFVGDNYPTVLRSMVATHCNVLLVESFEADGASWEQLVKVFASRRIQAVRLEDVLLTEIPVHFDRIPLLQVPRERFLAIAGEMVDAFDQQWLEKRRRSRERYG